MHTVCTMMVWVCVCSCVESSMCKILMRAYYNFKSIDSLNRYPSFEVDGRYSVMYRLCTDYNQSLHTYCSDNSGQYGNIVMVDNYDKSCTSLAYIEKSVDKTVWDVQYHDRLDVYYNTSDDAKNASGTAISYSVPVTSGVLLARGIKSVKFGLICNTSLPPDRSIQINRQIDTDLWIFFEGIQACGLGLIEPSVFMRNHIVFPISFIFISIIVLILRRVNERLMMAAFGMQFGIFISIVSMANLELQFHFTPITTSILFVCSVLLGSFFSFSCYVSRNSSIMVLFLGAAVSSSYTVLTTYVMITDDGVSSKLFWYTSVSIAVLMILMYSVPRFYDKLGHMFVVAIDVPFYLFMSISVIVGWYPDLLTIKKAKEYGIVLEAREGNWWFLGGQMILSLILIVDSVLLYKKNKRERDRDDEQNAEDTAKISSDIDSRDLQSM